MYKIGNLILSGKFVVEAEIGAGTFGTVYKVRDTITGELWALKQIFEKSARDSFEMGHIFYPTTTMPLITKALL
jgi:serine/threonine protein kinase